MSLSDSVGGAILRAGEFGHMTLVPGGRRCYCGKDGCLDAYCSARVLSHHTGGSLSAFFDGLRAGDPAKHQIWLEYLEYLAVAANNLHTSFDCPVIIVGYVGACLEEFGAPMNALLKTRNTFASDASYLRFCRLRRRPHPDRGFPPNPIIRFIPPGRHTDLGIFAGIQSLPFCTKSAVELVQGDHFLLSP